jgi:hypothetical protein
LVNNLTPPLSPRPASVRTPRRRTAHFPRAPSARCFTLRSLSFDRTAFSYSLSSPRLTAQHIREWLRLCEQPAGPAGEQRRLALDVFTNNLSAPCGPLGASSAVVAWAEIAALVANDRRHTITVSAEAHAAGLLAAITMVSIMTHGVLRVRDTFVVHWDGWREEWSPLEYRGCGGGGSREGGGSGGLPSLATTPERVAELAEKLRGLPEERRPCTLRVCLARRRHGGEVLPEGVEAVRQGLAGVCTVKVIWI